MPRSARRPRRHRSGSCRERPPTTRARSPRPRRTEGGSLGKSDRLFERVYAVVAAIPRGRVATYGEVAGLVGVPRGARAVGWALRALGEERAAEVPWHRVVGHGGRISPRPGPGAEIQRRRLRAEGVRFVAGRVDLARHALRQSQTMLTRGRPRRSRAR